MNKIELKNYPLSTKVVKEWFMKEMIESFKDDTVPTEFKDFMLEQGIEDEKVETLINLNYRSLFDVFDKNEIYVNIKPIFKENQKNIEGFYYRIPNCSDMNDKKCNTRKEAEFLAVKECFDLLEQKLKPIEFLNLKEE